MASVKITGRLLASHFQAGGEVPLSGQIFFTPTMEKVPTGEGVHLPAATSVELDGDGRFEVELLSAGFSWEVGFSLRYAGAFVPVGCFNFLPEPGVDRVNFADIVPITDPVTSQPMLRGEDGVGVEAITTEAGELVFTLTDGKQTRIPVPQGIPGTGVDTITLQGSELVFALSDGSETRIPAPEGTPGDEGVGISSITLEGGELVFTLTDGSESRLPAPKGDPGDPGEPGDPGVSPPAPTLSVGNVETLPNGSTATATITGDTPNYTLALGIPQGAPGAKGDKGETGNPSTMTLVGAGRPDTPATLSTANQTAVANAAVGATFTSTDGAGAGAWTWVKTPTGWAVTYADTGWRDISSLIPAEFKGYTFRVRRIANEVHFYVNVSQQTGTLQNYQFPAGFKLPSFDLQRNLYRGGVHSAVMGSFRIYNGAFHYTGGTSQAINGSSYEVYAAEDSWPATLPGTPA